MSHQFLSQPGQRTLNVQIASSSCAFVPEGVSPALTVPACTLPGWFTVIEGDSLAGEIP